jgi:hypothetical protein
MKYTLVIQPNKTIFFYEAVKRIFVRFSQDKKTAKFDRFFRGKAHIIAIFGCLKSILSYKKHKKRYKINTNDISTQRIREEK